LPELIEALPRPLWLVIMADHGDCMGEDGLWGHSFYHPKVMEIPMTVLKIDESRGRN
jgi:arylsulfatase A-like enzyme